MTNSNDVQPDMLILARESRAMTQTQLADATQVSQANISKYESGLLKVSDEHLERIATVLDYPKSFFFRREKRYGFGSSCTYHRKRKSLSAADLRTLLAKMNILRIRVGSLLNSVDIVSENAFQHFDIDEFDGDIECIAQLVRNSWRLPPGPIPNLVEAIESAGGIVVFYPFGTRKIDAISQWLPGVPPLFLVNAESPGDRVRLTLAHEVGHVIMQQHSTENTDIREQEADRFAAEFLMPARDISSDLTSVSLASLARLKPYWRVSIAALIRRAHDLGKITDRQYRSLYEQMGKAGYRISEPIPIPLEKTATYDDLKRAHLDALGYTEDELRQLVDMNRREFVEEFLPEDRRAKLADVPKLRIVGGTLARGYSTG